MYIYGKKSIWAQVVMTPFGHYDSWLQGPALFLGARFKVVLSEFLNELL